MPTLVPNPDGVPSESICLETSPAIGKLALALSKAQSAMTAAKKDREGNVAKEGRTLYSYGYATLASVWDAVRAPLAANELAVIQTTEQAGTAGVCVVTTLAHSSGEWVRGRLYMPVRQADAQGFGSALTYARRYALSAIAGIAPDDDDAAAAVKPGPAKAVYREKPAAAAAPKAPESATSATGMTEREQFVATKFEAQIDQAPSEPVLRRLCMEAYRAAGDRDASPAFRAWYITKKDAAKARLALAAGKAVAS